MYEVRSNICHVTNVLWIITPCSLPFQAFVIYSFAMLVFRFVALQMEETESGPIHGHSLSDEEMVRRVKKLLNHKSPIRHLFPLCCMRPWAMDGDCEFFIKCRRGVAQYIVWRVLATLVAFILTALGVYEEGNFSPASSYLYVSLVFWTSQGW